MSKYKNMQNVFEAKKVQSSKNIKSEGDYTNRELSWLEFNKRVLHQSIRQEVPLIEKLKFLGITGSNLDEFIMVRLSSIINKIKLEKSDTDISGLSPFEEYRQVFKEILKFKRLQEETYNSLKKKLVKQNMVITKYKKLDNDEMRHANRIFMKDIFPLLTPITFDSTKDFPLIKSKQLCIVVGLQDKRFNDSHVVSIIPLTPDLDRLYEIPSKVLGERKFVLLEEIIYNNLDKIFINKTIEYNGCVRILREADIEMDTDSSIYIVDRMKQILLQREYSEPIFMDISSNIPKPLFKLLIKIFGISKHNVFKSTIPIDLSFWVSKPIRNVTMEYKDFEGQYPEGLVGEHDMFTSIDNNDVLLHHPYDSFNPVVKFLEHAASDKDVLAIRQTLYRVSSDQSPIVEALCKAARNGKQVNVLLEIKARFDENRNISLIEKLKISGCKIIYGIEEFKTHCKFILIVRQSKKGLKTYCHIGTGNYNDKTSEVYTDISYFSSNGKLGHDLITVFNILSGFSDPDKDINKIYFAPFNIRTKLYKLIDREIKNSEAGKKAALTLKLNSLSDKGIIDRLYKASDKGVQINIVCRGICSMRKINKNIRIRSVIGKYLEHSRIYSFYNNGKPEIFISSADLLTRNLDKRVEIMVPITESESRNKLFKILEEYYRDTFNTYVMDKDSDYKLIKKDKSINIHTHFEDESKQQFSFGSLPGLKF